MSKTISEVHDANRVTSNTLVDDWSERYRQAVVAHDLVALYELLREAESRSISSRELQLVERSLAEVPNQPSLNVAHLLADARKRHPLAEAYSSMFEIARRHEPAVRLAVRLLPTTVAVLSSIVAALGVISYRTNHSLAHWPVLWLFLILSLLITCTTQVWRSRPALDRAKSRFPTIPFLVGGMVATACLVLCLAPIFSTQPRFMSGITAHQETNASGIVRLELPSVFGNAGTSTYRLEAEQLASNNSFRYTLMGNNNTILAQMNSHEQRAIFPVGDSMSVVCAWNNSSARQSNTFSAWLTSAESLYPSDNRRSRKVNLLEKCVAYVNSGKKNEPADHQK